MAIDRIEIAIECDDINEDGVPVLAMFVELLGLDPTRDVEAIIESSDTGQPVLVAVLTHDEEEAEHGDV